ncbi:conserved hypothetical protein [Oceanicaulis sp. 350]|nr:conserved hypothetical protein [Oceanicaulis sp. 350]
MKEKANPLKISAIVSTKGRSSEIRQLLDSLQAQSVGLFEVIIVDQNEDNRLEEVLRLYDSLPISRIWTPTEAGVCRGRNIGWNKSTADVVFFPDDDCWYPNWFVEKADAIFRRSGADVVSGRAADELGRSVNGRFLGEARSIDRNTVWVSQIEWTTFFHRNVLSVVGGFDEKIGPGSGSRWGAHEIQDVSLRALHEGFSIYYDPELYGHHAEMIYEPNDEAGRHKIASYARGLGYVLAKHKYSEAVAVYWGSRSFLKATLYLLIGKGGMSKIYFNVGWERISGFFAAKGALKTEVFVDHDD